MKNTCENNKNLRKDMKSLKDGGDVPKRNDVFNNIFVYNRMRDYGGM